MVLLDTIVEVSTSPDPDRLQFAHRPILESVCHITGQNGFSVGLTTIDHDLLELAVSLECLAKRTLGGREIAPLAEPGLDRVVSRSSEVSVTRYFLVIAGLLPQHAQLPGITLSPSVQSQCCTRAG
jgi:hypothetical protein